MSLIEISQCGGRGVGPIRLEARSRHPRAALGHSPQRRDVRGANLRATRPATFK